MLRILPKSKKLMALMIASIALVGGGAAAVSAEQYRPNGTAVATPIPKVKVLIGERVGTHGKSEPFPIRTCSLPTVPGTCYFVKMGPGGSMVKVGAAPIACPIWYLDGAGFRPRSVQSGCVTVTGQFKSAGHSKFAFSPRNTMADKRCTSQGCFQRQLSEVYVVGVNRVITGYALDVNTWVKIGDPR